MKEPFKWDEYSDQPAQLKDKNYKKQMRRKELKSLIKTVFIALIMLPISLVMMPFVKRKEIHNKDFFALGLDVSCEKESIDSLIEELEVQSLSLRLKLWEMQSIEELLSFVKRHTDKKINLKILQDRENIEDLTLLETNLRTIFTQLHPYIDTFEIASTVNRAKWGFFSIDEYNRFYQVAYNLQQSEFKSIKLLGSGVIDFEFHFTAHTLFNLYKYKYNGISSLLYVDRRGAPENTQLGFTLSDKIALLNTMIWLSPKSENKLYITETNWPLSNTAPYAPTSEFECVSQSDYANFMLRYYLLAFASQQVNSLAWHQLIAPGYGLIDNRDGIQKREAFYTYKFMIQKLKNAQFLRLDIKRGYYIFQCLVEDEKLLQIHWSLKETTLKNEDFFEVYSRDGAKIEDATLNIGDSPLYIFITKAVAKKVNSSTRMQ